MELEQGEFEKQLDSRDLSFFCNQFMIPPVNIKNFIQQNKEDENLLNSIKEHFLMDLKVIECLQQIFIQLEGDLAKIYIFLDSLQHNYDERL